MFVHDIRLQELVPCYRRRWHAGQLAIVVQEHMNRHVKDPESNDLVSPYAFIKHKYGDEEYIASVYRWNESLDKIMCFDFA